MKTKRAAIIAAGVVVAALFTPVLMARGDRDKVPPPREVTLTGKIVDLQSYMTDKFESSDHVKCTQGCIQAGVPAALETEDGLIIIGQGPKGPARTIAPLAFRYAELKGKLYERNGVMYIDIKSVMAAKDPKAEEETDSDSDTDPGWDEEDEADSDDLGEDET